MKALLGPVVVIGSVAVSFAADSQKLMMPEVGPQVDQCVQEAMAAYDMVGVGAGVVVDGELVYETGYGVKHRTQGGAVDAHTLFRHGSVGKMITAAATLRLVDQGIVDLNDRVTEYVPELHFAPGLWSADQITVRHLIANTAAIPSYRVLPEGSLSDWALTLAELPLLAKPGVFYNYSNSNFALADLVVERASGISYYDFVEAEIYARAGMSDSTRYPSTAMATGNYSFGHADDGQVYAPDGYAVIDDGFFSAHDMARWAQLMLGGCGEVLDRGSCAAMQQRQTPRIYGDVVRSYSIGGGYYGYGLFVDEFPAATITSHGGGMPGWVANVSWIRAEGFAVALLANTWPSGYEALVQAAVCIYESLLGVTTPDMSQPSDPQTWSRFAGTYDATYDDGYHFEVVVEQEAQALLMTAPNPQNPDENITRELDNIAGGAFIFWVNPESWWTVTFIETPGDPSSIRWMRNQRFGAIRRVAPLHGGGRVSP
jgi:CubicO group peptidase (beta-lactamase class C family)